MLKLFFAIVITFLSVTFVAAQTLDKIESKYGKPVQIYEIRPDVLMSVKFDAEGQASELRIERHNATDSTVYLDATFPPRLLKEIVDELVPVLERGERGKFSDLVIMISGSSIQTEDYGNVSITYYSSSSGECSGVIAIVIKWKSRLLKEK